MRTLLLLFLLGLPAVLQAQDAVALDLSPGTRVRVYAPTVLRGRSDAMVWKVSPDTIYLGDLNRVRTALPVAAVERMQAKRGDFGIALIGMVAGGWIGGRLGSKASFARERPDMHPAWHIVEISSAGAVGAAAGGLAGTVVESLLGWKQVLPMPAKR